MRLEHLHLDRLPGLPEAFDLVPGPGVNLVLGPNAVGKSSVARAVRGLLWPTRTGRSGHELTARFRNGLEAVRSGGPAVTWSRAGETVPAPEVPGEHLAACYRLGAPDLLVRSAGDVDRHLAGELRREMTGGVDLDGWTRRLDRPDKGTATRLAKALQTAMQATLAVGRSQAGLAAQIADLENLKQRLAAAEDARLEVDALGKAREFLAARAELAAAKVVRDTFPATMARVREDDTTEFTAWRERIAAMKARIREQTERLAEVENELADLAPRAGGDPEELLTRFEVRVRACGEAAREASRAGEALAGAERAWEEAQAALADPAALPEDDSLPDDDAFAGLVARHRSALAETARREALGKLVAEMDPGHLPSRVWPVVMLVVGGLFVLAPMVPDALPSGYAYGLLAAGLLLAVGGVNLLVGAHRKHALADRARRMVDRTETAGSPDPQDGQPWTLGRNLDDGGWLRDLERLREAARCRLAWRSAEASATRARKELDEGLVACGEVVAPWGLASPASAISAEEMLAELRRRRDRRQALDQLQSDLLSQQAEAIRDRNDTHKRFESLLARLGLPVGTAEAAPILDLVERLPAWQAADRAWSRAQQKVALLESAQVRPDLAALEMENLAERLVVAENLAASEPELRETLASLRRDVETARAGDTRAAALAEEEVRRDDLAAWRERSREQSVTAALFEDLRQEHDELVTPPQLERARELFGVFTGGRHTVTVAATDDGPVFRSRDRHSGRWLELDELSGGTRAQLLLAVRLAFLEHAETGPRPPLFLDESLTTADGRRLDAIAGSLGLLARDTERQVFYLTSNPADVGTWRRALTGRGLPEPTVLDLAELRGRGTTASAAELSPPPSTSLPDPAGHDAASYGLAVGARRFDPREDWRAADTIHLATGDVALIHGLLERGLTRAGILAAALEEDREMLPGDRARLAGALAVLKAFIPAWRVGRPRPLTPGDMDASGAVSEKMRAGVLELLAANRCHGARFMAALRGGGVRSFRSDKMDDLEEYLADAGCLDHRAPLDADGLVHEVQKRVRTSPGEVRTLVLHLAAAVPSTIADDPSSAHSS